MSFSIDRVLSLQWVSEFWGIEVQKLLSDLHLRVFKLDGNDTDYFIHQSDYNTLTGYFLKQNSDMEVLDISKLRRALKKSFPTYVSHLEKFLENRETYVIIDPASGQKLSSWYKTSNLFQHYCETQEKYHLNSASKALKLDTYSLYTLIQHFKLPYNLQEQVLSEVAYNTIAKFLQDFALVVEPEHEKRIKKLNVPILNVRYVGKFVERAVMDYVLNTPANTGQTGVTTRPLGETSGYLSPEMALSYLRERGVSTSLDKLLTSSVLPRNDYSLLTPKFLDTVVSYFKRGYGFSVSLAIAGGKVGSDLLDGCLTLHQFRLMLNRLHDKGVISKSFKAYVLKQGLVNRGLDTVILYSKADIREVLKSHILGVSPDYPSTDYVSTFYLAEFAQSPAGAKLDFPQGYGVSPLEGVKNRTVNTIVVSSSVHVTNKKNLNRKTYDAYVTWLTGKKTDALAELEEELNV